MDESQGNLILSENCQSQKLHDFIYVTFLKYQHYRNEEISSCQGLDEESMCGYEVRVQGSGAYYN